MIKNETTERLDSFGLKRLEDFIDREADIILPLYEARGFINTVEGWNLLGKLKDPDHPEFIEAKKAYYDSMNINPVKNDRVQEVVIV